MRAVKILLTTILLTIFISTNAFAAERIDTLEKSGLFGKYKPSGIAIRGYDTVAYFTEGKPVDGNDDFTTEWEGATWRFSSQENKDLFVAEPEKYAPQYGGYCAYGVAVGNLVKIEPELWTIIDDKLYLNYNEDLNAKWKKDIPGYIKTADSKFEDLLKED